MPQNIDPIVLYAPTLKTALLETLLECTRRERKNIIFRPTEFIAAVAAIKSDLQALGIKINIESLPGGPYSAAVDKALSEMRPYYLERYPYSAPFAQELALRQDVLRIYRARNSWTLSKKVRTKMAEAFTKALAQTRRV